MIQNEEVWLTHLDMRAAIQITIDRMGQQEPHEGQREVPSPAPGEE